MTDGTHADDGDETNDEQVHRILVDRGIDGNSKAKLTVAGYSRFFLSYELVRNLQRRMGDLKRSALDDGDHVGNVHVKDNKARIEWFDDLPKRTAIQQTADR